PDSQQISVFTDIFIIVWLGSAVVTINAKLLGGSVICGKPLCKIAFMYCRICLVFLR
ncbi:2802_t:CDS:2, partial [Diversispora eburnea]